MCCSFLHLTPYVIVNFVVADQRREVLHTYEDTIIGGGQYEQFTGHYLCQECCC
jgi:hypothetical protein